MKNRITFYFLVTLIFLFNTANSSDTSIPLDFHTYIDDSDLFSISYPQNWELGFSAIDGIVTDTDEYLKKIDSQGTLKNASVLFFAGKPNESGFMPNVSIVVTPMKGSSWTLDNLIDAAVEGRKKDSIYYNEITRTNTIIDDRESIILESESKYPGSDSFRTIEMITRTEKFVWIVTCIVNSHKIEELRLDFISILKSLRILKKV